MERINTTATPDIQVPCNSDVCGTLGVVALGVSQCFLWHIKQYSDLDVLDIVEWFEYEWSGQNISTGCHHLSIIWNEKNPGYATLEISCLFGFLRLLSSSTVLLLSVSVQVIQYVCYQWCEPKNQRFQLILLFSLASL